jgi:hypothetical protein
MRRIIYAVAIMLVALGGVLAATVPASADVLVNQPASSVCVGKTFKVGVWYQQFSGGPRAYRVAVYNPSWRRVLYKHGRAPSSHWKFWRIRASRTGKYHTVYRIRYKGRWVPYRTVTQAHRC